MSWNFTNKEQGCTVTLEPPDDLVVSSESTNDILRSQIRYFVEASL